MAAVIRVRRKRTADPADNLVFSCKKPKHGKCESETAGTDPLEVENVFRFAGTSEEKDHRVEHIQHVIKSMKDRLKRSGLNTGHEKLNAKTRELRKIASESNRFKVISNLRNIKLDVQEKTIIKTGSEETTPCTGAGDGKPNNVSVCDGAEAAAVEASLEESTTQTEANKLFCLYDVLQEVQEGSKKEKSPKSRKETPQNQDELMCNNVRMIREKLTIEDETKPKHREPEYVYDFYYADPTSLDWSALDNVVSVTGYNDMELVYGEAEMDDEYCDDDDDDSNDESNWRNEYPDEEEHERDSLSSDDDDDEDNYYHQNDPYRRRDIDYEYEVQDYNASDDDDEDGLTHDHFIV
ncbi:putative RNA polymerase II nuclear localization protein SLC7A6OS [Saccoglossus kowalevskii]|uniref:Probable RNA polymerase II nuclear localization protein SLC7A6OS n=1 Tax=Saccoglossus kowalevskii TaxID=10224 RepID=A0ABM0MAV5_SACKO|nr:PREDICTED: probable RNA polymerase II nuclear localization protein SLC7A6OS-like [Saccoglossus kowalevskii]